MKYVSSSYKITVINVHIYQFSVLNGVEQGGLLSPILFAVYIDGMLERLEESCIGW